MAVSFDILGPNDKAALLALSTPEYIHAAGTALASLGYKVHQVETHDDFDSRFGQVSYHLVVLEENFASSAREENRSLQRLQSMPMNQRRHAATLLIGNSWPSLDRKWAWKESVAGLVNAADLASIQDVIQQVVSEHTNLYATFKDVQSQLAKGK
ncbi:MAG TPA: hypothetical protein VEH27_15250 [Methylomirabilota bacterium]|nr:hypothetical protein [Methylomirabilota bacterium]